MDALIGTFHIDWRLIVAQLVNFAIVFVVLYIFALKPLNTLMRERSKRIEQGLEDAHRNAALVAEAKQLYDSELAKARHEAHTLMQTMHRDIELKRTELLDTAHEEAERIMVAGREVLRAEKDVILKEAEKEIASLVVSGVEKVLTQHVDAKIDHDAITKSVAHLK